ncbi:MAG: RIP metalloprotease RseP [Deltaproteobacteria bacterium]|nr:RIP metalloprotease RseP [Deltaproteobacteria bacterium]
MITSVVGVIILLGGLIFFHELGHYLVAKLFGVKVEVFPLGFGKKIASRKIGETEYCLSLFPLGGYVKLMGDDLYKGVPPEEAHRAFATQKLHKRFLIVAAGPFANLFLAYILYVCVFWFGKPTEGTKIGEVVVDSPAWQAGIREGDRILALGDKQVKTWNDLEETLKPLAGTKLELRIERSSQELKVPVTVSTVKTKNPYGEDELAGGIKGISPLPLAPVVGISNSHSMAYSAGLRTGDLITKIDSTPITVFSEINDQLEQMGATTKPVIITVKRELEPGSKKSKTQELSFTLTLAAKKPSPEQLSPFGLAEKLGIFPSELFVRAVTPGSPAEQGGMQPHDRVARTGEKPAYNFESIVDYVQEQGSKGQLVQLTLERGGQLVQLSLKPSYTAHEDPLTRETINKYLVGFSPLTVFAEPEMVHIKIREPLHLLAHSGQEVWVLSSRMVVSIAKLIVGKISVKNLGGPVLIASVAGRSLDAGIIPFLLMMALISINLFLLNLFPIPILDGGHLFFFVIEAIKGKPVSIRTMEIANQLGLALILMLVGLTLFNDISRMVLH